MGMQMDIEYLRAVDRMKVEQVHVLMDEALEDALGRLDATEDVTENEATLDLTEQIIQDIRKAEYLSGVVVARKGALDNTKASKRAREVRSMTRKALEDMKLEGLTLEHD